ncbi:thiamine pyrophosphate-binding protein [Jatrophihabitans sp. DSM 45814]
MKVYDALAKAFVDEGTTAVFGIMGDANQYWMNAISQRGVRLYDVRHEGAGLAMADGFARVSGQPGVVTTTSGPGTAQLATTMIVASRAQTPLVAFCGDSAWGKESPQAMNSERFAAAIECGYVRVTSAENTFEGVQKAFYLARTEQRPIMLTAASNVQQEEFDELDEYRTSTDLLVAPRLYPDPEAIERIADLVTSSQRPVIIVGRGAMASGAGEAIVKLATRTGALVATSLLAMNYLRDSYDYHAGISGLYSTKSAMELLQEADCVIGVGATLNHYTTEQGYLYPSAKFVHFDVRPNVVMGDGRPADYVVQADAKVAVELLDSVLIKRGFSQTGFRTVEVKEKLAGALFDPLTYDIEPGLMDPRDVCRVIDENVPSSLGLVIGTGHYSHFPTMQCVKARPFHVLNKFFSCIGQSLTTGIGAALAAGNRPTLIVEGDGAFMMHVGEFETAVRYGIPILVIVLNDQALGMEVQKARVKGLDENLGKISTPDLGTVGVALGGDGRLVRTPEDLAKAIEEYLASPRPMIIDARVSQKVVAVQYRRLWYGDQEI